MSSRAGGSSAADVSDDGEPSGVSRVRRGGASGSHGELQGRGSSAAAVSDDGEPSGVSWATRGVALEVTASSRAGAHRPLTCPTTVSPLG